MSEKRIPVSFIFKSMDRTSGPLGKIESKFKGLSRSGKRFNTILKRSARLAGLNNKQFKKLGNSLGKVKSGYTKLGGLAKGVATIGVVTGLGLGLATTHAAEFEKQMSVVKSLTGEITNKEFKGLSLEAKKMGALTSFSAQQAAEGLEYLSLAGFKPQESMKSLEKVLRVAEAGSLDLGLASDILTDSSSALGASFDKNMGKVQRLSIISDQFAIVQSKSNTNIQQLGEAVTFGGGALANMGIPLHQIIAGFGKLADAGIKGSMAGTNMGAMFEQLAKPSGKVSSTMMKLGLDMKTLPLNDMPTMLTKVGGALDKLKDGNFKTAIMTEMFGKRGKRAYLALKEAGIESLKKLSNEVKKSEGSAEAMAKERMNNFMGNWTSLKSAMQGISIEIGSIITQNKFLNSGFSKVVSLSQLLAKSLMVANGNSILDVFGKEAKALSPTQRSLIKFATDFKTGMSEAFQTGKEVFISIKDSLSPLLERLGLTEGGIGKIIGKFVVFTTVIAPVIAGIVTLGMAAGAIISGFSGIFSIVTGGIGVFTSLMSIIGGMTSFLSGFGSIIFALTGPVGWIIGAVAAVGTGIYFLYKNWDKVTRYIAEKFNWLKSLLPDSIKSVMGISVEGEAPEAKSGTSVQKTMNEIAVSNRSNQKNELLVKFDNAPKGTSLEPNKVDSDLKLDLGFAMEGI